VSGVGRGIAECLAEEGAAVLINDIKQEAAEETQRLLLSQNASAAVIVSDIATAAGAAAAVEAAVRSYGRLDLLVNNAGRQVIKSATDLAPDEWDAVLSVNLKGIYLCCKSAIPVLARNGGAIVNIASVHATATIAGFSAYAASKAGILGLTRALALECAPMSVRVNAVSPGTIDTPLLQAFFDSFENPEQARMDYLKFHPIGRFGTPRDIGKLVCFLASDDASFITGAEIIADGGMTASLFKQ
jgi:NAD(P)-dependent dehydrogenase (short-subunit alcohol dehydrogenase family)